MEGILDTPWNIYILNPQKMGGVFFKVGDF